MRVAEISTLRTSKSLTELTYMKSVELFNIKAIRAICCIIMLLFLGHCYESIDAIAKVIAVTISFLLFIKVFIDFGVTKNNLLYIAVICLFVFVQFALTSFRYNQNCADFFQASYYYAFALLLPAFSIVLTQSKDKLLYALENTAIVISCFMLFAALFYNLLGVNITEITRTRSGMLRINAPFLVQLAPLLSLYLATNGKSNRKVIHVASVLLSMLSIAFVYQGRLPILLIVVCVAVFFIGRNWCSSNRAVLAILVFGLISIWLFNIGPLGEIVESFSPDSSYGGNTTTRINEIEYYINTYLDYPVNGVGLIGRHDTAYNLLAGPYGAYYVEDVGVISALASIGLWIIPIYVIPLCLYARKTLSNTDIRALGVSTIVYLIGTSFTTLIAFPFYDPLWSLFVAIAMLPNTNNRKYPNLQN